MSNRDRSNARRTLALVLVLVVACRVARDEPDVARVASDPAPISASAPSDAAPVAKLGPIPEPDLLLDPSTLRVRLERTWCYGECPQYVLTIASDGVVTFVGKRHTRVYGEAQGRLDANGMRELVDAFRTARFATVEVTPIQVYDAPGLSILYEHDGTSKRVWSFYGTADLIEQISPAERGNYAGNHAVDALGETIDAICHVEQWIGVRQ